MADLRPVYVVGDGDVKGPASSSNNFLPLFADTTGKLLKSSGTGVTAQGLAILDDNTPAEQRNTIGLEQVNNTSDVNKPVSTAQQTALNLKQDKLQYTPVQQGGGIGQATNKIFIGFGTGRLKATVDSTDFGNVIFDGNTATESVVGVAKVATTPIATAGTNDTDMMTAAKNRAVLNGRGLWNNSIVTTDLDAELTTGVYSAVAPAIVTDGGFFQVFNTRFGADARWQSQLLMGVSSSRILYRSKGNYAGASSPLVEFYNTGNCQLVGASVGFYRDTAPQGFLKENGAAVSRTTYAALFAAIGTKFGAGDGVTTFNLPDSRALFSRALDDSKGIDVGRQMGSTQAQSIQSHNHAILTKALNFIYSAPVGGQAPGTFTTGATEATGGAETRPANIAKLYCIKF